MASGRRAPARDSFRWYRGRFCIGGYKTARKQASSGSVSYQWIQNRARRPRVVEFPRRVRPDPGHAYRGLRANWRRRRRPALIRRNGSRSPVMARHVTDARVPRLEGVARRAASPVPHAGHRGILIPPRQPLLNPPHAYCRNASEPVSDTHSGRPQNPGTPLLNPSKPLCRKGSEPIPDTHFGR